MEKTKNMKKSCICVIALLLLLLSGCICDDSYYLRFRCNYRHQYGYKSYIGVMKQQIDSVKIKTYIDKKYNVNIFYPSSFHMADTSKAGMAYFANSITDYKVSLRLIVDSINSNRDVEKAVAMDMADTTIICLEKGNDFYFVKGNSFYKKCYLIDNNWIRYILFYREECEGAIDRLVGLIKEWDPRVKPYEKENY